jgi:hypothetical protein
MGELNQVAEIKSETDSDVKVNTRDFINSGANTCGRGVPDLSDKFKFFEVLLVRVVFGAGDLSVE